MKKSRCFNNPKPVSLLQKAWQWIFLALALGASGALAAPDVVVVPALIGATGSSTNTFPPYLELSGNWAGSTLKSLAPGMNSSRYGSRFATTGTPSFKLQPTLAEPGGTYFVELTHNYASSISADIVVGISVVGGSGLPATTTGFQKFSVTNSWWRIGTLVLDPGVTNPVITFTHASGAVSRFYSDGFRFVNTNLVCITGLPEIGVVNGPLAAGQTTVDVAGVAAGATNVSVYADNVLIGQLDSNIVAGVNTVTTTPLVKGQQITVSQWANGIESCRALNGTLIGGGANPRVRVSVSIKQDTALGGPIGADGGAPGLSTVLKYLGSTNTVNGGWNSAPCGGIVIHPSACWQTVSFQRGIDPSFGWQNPDNQPLLGNFGTLESVVFAIDDLEDTGPFRVYIDTIMNGTTVIQDFESAVSGDQEVLFKKPGTSSSTSGYLLAPSPGSISPNIAEVSNQNADSGVNSALVSWQFKDTGPGNWVRLMTQGSGTPNPQVDLNQPITFRILVLPVGETVGNQSAYITSQPQSTNVPVGTPIVTLAVAATGPDPSQVQYQWQFNGQDIQYADYYLYDIWDVDPSAYGAYTCIVSWPGSSCTETSRVAILGMTGTGNGLSGQYYSGQTNFSGAPTLSRLDPTVNFDWVAGSPDPSIAVDRFTVRWAGQVEPFTTETYTFYTTTDDGVKLWVNGALLVDKWLDEPATTWSGSIALTNGQKYDIVMEYYENAVSASAKLEWSSPTQAKAVIPTTQLYAVAPAITTQPAVGDILNAGDNYTLSVTATGTYLAYQWVKSGVAIPGANSSSLTLNPVRCADAGEYAVLVSNGAGSVTSDIVTLVVNATTLTATGPSNQMVSFGSSVTLSTTASGSGPLKYLWRKDGQELVGETNSSLVIPSFSVQEIGWYCVEITDLCLTLTNCARVLPPVRLMYGGLVFDAGAGTFTFSLGTTTGTVYNIEYTDNLENPVWTPLRSVTGDGTTMVITDQLSPVPPKRFYRAWTQSQ